MNYMMFSCVDPTLDMVVNGLFFLSLMERVKLVNNVCVSGMIKYK